MSRASLDGIAYTTMLEIYASKIIERSEKGKISEERYGECLEKLDEWEEEYWRKTERGEVE